MVWHGMRHATHHQQTSHVTHLMFIKSGCRAARPPMPELTLLPTLANTCRDACYLPSSALRCADLLCAIPSTRRQARAHTHAYTPGTWRQPDASDLGAEGEDATRTRLRGPWPRRLSPIALHPAVFCAFLSAPRGARVHRVSEHSAVWLFFRVLYRFVWLCVALCGFVLLCVAPLRLRYVWQLGLHGTQRSFTWRPLSHASWCPLCGCAPLHSCACAPGA